MGCPPWDAGAHCPLALSVTPARTLATSHLLADLPSTWGGSKCHPGATLGTKQRQVPLEPASSPYPQMGIKVFPTESLPKIVGPHLQTSLSQASFHLPLMATSVIYKGLLRYKHLGILGKLPRDITGLCTASTSQGGILRADLTSECFWRGRGDAY